MQKQYNLDDFHHLLDKAFDYAEKKGFFIKNIFGSERLTLTELHTVLQNACPEYKTKTYNPKLLKKLISALAPAYEINQETEYKNAKRNYRFYVQRHLQHKKESVFSVKTVKDNSVVTESNISEVVLPSISVSLSSETAKDVVELYLRSLAQANITQELLLVNLERELLQTKAMIQQNKTQLFELANCLNNK